MCGIVGYVGDKFVDSLLVAGLERLEYRGYDSAGIATLNRGRLKIKKMAGKIQLLKAKLKEDPLDGELGIGHTRWATHGEPTTGNAHPHTDCRGEIAVIHNGIIENFQLLRDKLIKEGHIFKTDTDTEIIAHLIEKFLKDDLHLAVRKSLKFLKGSYALAVISRKDPNEIVVARWESPLVIGMGKKENFLASDVGAILNLTSRIIFLEDGETATIAKNEVKVFGKGGRLIKKRVKRLKWEILRGPKRDGYRHFMLKEIHEQPNIIRYVLKRRISRDKNDLYFENINLSEKKISKIDRIIIQACGTSWHVGLVGKYLFEKHLRLHTEVDISSEFRYRNPVAGGDTLVMAISQSGETADTLAGIRLAKSKFLQVLSLCNTIESTIARESDGVIYVYAGPEIGVASTKAYTAELLALFLLTINWGILRNSISREKARKMIGELEKIPSALEELLDNQKEIHECAQKFYQTPNFLFLGRSFNYPTALEGALKLKEISYIHAEGYAAGEMKHGPIALVDEKMPVVCIALKDSVYEKMVSNIREVKARNGKVIAVATKGDDQIRKYADHTIFIPPIAEEFSPILAVIPLQLLAYHIAIKRGCHVDQPRNLAKSVTVE
ncbi:glutamine--fructose-6-phosphate transaminase (isomerizing) [Candidatus Aerophobetes bacterium]|uniref:Glutamine--fructose-6-phosphate aminotransferase [isomerizing] n=1 Tax=Aerophobetes bacterium TaxID=2030807 RepID=A0A523YLR0_UNCAE|nr:MAG: glutamine--fructose-6-phosphate transaminase (isomerizing) [Candidatus Aerophobetes bacterium]